MGLPGRGDSVPKLRAPAAQPHAYMCKGAVTAGACVSSQAQLLLGYAGDSCSKQALCVLTLVNKREWQPPAWLTGGPVALQ
jgi:hypothetical protein